MNTPATLRWARFEWQPSALRLLVDGQPAPLGTRAQQVLAVLAEAGGRVVGKDELIGRVWRGLVVEENNLQVQISALRKVLGPAGIATVPGRGYRLELPDTAVHADATAVPARPGGLPPEPSPLLGRAQELRLLTELLRGHRLVSVVGPGGVGKTRLALAAARSLQAHWPGGVRLLEAADIADPALLVPALAALLQTGDGSGTDAVTRVTLALQGQSLLLVLDNCEHLVEAAAALAEALLTRAPGVHLLVTSQIRLNLAAEQLLPLSPLALPAPDDPEPDERHGALQLFAERARRVQPDFALGPHNAALVASLCRRLDGLPLAIELAAARLRLLGLQGLHDRLHERLRLLTGGARDAPQRQRTLQATLDWSHALLSGTEQTVLRRLGVFVGGFPLDLAQQVASDEGVDPWAVLEALDGLVDKSLVSVEQAKPLRYRLLESTRAFALEQLARSGEAPVLARRHAQALCALFVQLDEQRFGDDGRLDGDVQRSRLVPELGNARAALDWAQGPNGDAALAVQLAGASANAFMQVGLTLEMLPRMLALRGAVDERVPLPQAADFWRRLALLGGYGGAPLVVQREAVTQAVALARQAGSRRRLHAALAQAGQLALAQDQPQGTAALLAEMQALERPDDPPYLVVGRLGLEASWLSQQRRFDAAAAVLEQQAGLALQAGDRLAHLISLSNRACLLNYAQRYGEAADLAGRLLAEPTLPRGLNVVGFDLIHALAALGRVAEAQDWARRLQPQWHLSPVALHGSAALARLAAASGRLHDALQVLAAGDANRAAAGLPADEMTEQVRQYLQQACAAAGVSAQQQAQWQRDGAALDAANLVARALGRPG
jgi:predicted ATPase/DNA-binding winged helix-turn-helix (wHTH) protein